ncbi:molybdopterin synthase [Methanosarcinales archaeon ex4572_44]|nr:MAG: molybdopterin synthase [Methanosarcinales archaeon ex4484_138]PHP45191.1 MAG: molybdopterin synthase [Methanosarcinales archaeon ex4572_44]
MKIISVVGYKNSGKTALVEKLVGALGCCGRVGTVKHVSGEGLTLGGTDTDRHIASGAEVTVAVSGDELVKFVGGVGLRSALDELCDDGIDFAVVEGFKDSGLPKISIGIGSDTLDNVVKYVEVGQDFDEELVGELVRLTLAQRDYHTLKSLIRRVRANLGIRYAGAIGSFTGIVREVTGDVSTKGLEFEHYEDVAEEKIEHICSDLRAREGVVDVLMYHRMGWVGPGEDIVYIVVAASHREQLFSVLREAIERLKVEVPIWKKEYTEKGEYWVEGGGG